MVSVRALILDSATKRQQQLTYVALTVVVVAFWILHSTLPLIFPVDDAYITLHNARVIAGADDVSYGVSGWVGTTSPLHVAMTAVFALVMPAARALHTVMWLGALAYVLGLARLAFVHKASIAQLAVCVVVGCVIAEVPHQLMNGLETGWAMAALVWTLACASEGLVRARVTAALSGVLPLLRPELVVVSALVLALQATHRLQSSEPPRTAVRAIALDVAIALAVMLPFAMLLWIATGSPVPSTVSAKRHFFAQGCMDPAVKRMWLFNSLRAFAQLLGLLVPALVLLGFSRLGRIGLLFIFVLLFAYYREFPGALSHYEHRYMYPIVPFVLFGAMSCLGHASRPVRVFTTTMLIATAVVATWKAPSAWRRHVGYVAFTVNELETIAAWSRDHIPPTSKVLVHDVGYIAERTNLSLVDLVGLKTPASMDTHARLTWPTCGVDRGRAVHEIALRAQADYLIVLRQWDQGLKFAHSLADRGWAVERVRDTDRGYEVFKLTSPAKP
jgi:hypothetical protein